MSKGFVTPTRAGAKITAPPVEGKAVLVRGAGAEEARGILSGHLP